MNRDITKLNLYHELLANRYLLSVVLTNIMTTNRYVETLIRQISKKERTKEQKEKGSQTLLKERKEKKKERNNPTLENKEVLEFNSFTLSPNKFEQLLRTYDHDVVTDACVVMDKLIGIQGRSYKDIPRKLESLCKQFSLRGKLVEKISNSTLSLRSVDYEKIDNEGDAKKYIFTVPKYLRNVDKGCQYLIKKFSIEIEGVPCIE